MTCTLGTTIPEYGGTITANGVDVTEVWTNHAGALQRVWRKITGPVAASWSFNMEDQFIDDVECNGENDSVRVFHKAVDGTTPCYTCLSYNGWVFPAYHGTVPQTLTLNMGAANAGCSVELRTWWTADWLDKFDAVIAKGHNHNIIQDFGNGVVGAYTGTVDGSGNVSLTYSWEDDFMLYPKNVSGEYPNPASPLTKNGGIVIRTEDEDYIAHCYFHMQFFLTRDGVTKASNEWVGDNQQRTVTFSIS